MAGSWTISPLGCQMFLQKALAWRSSTARCRRACVCSGEVLDRSLPRTTWLPLPQPRTHLHTSTLGVYNVFHPAPRDACFHILFSVKQKYGAESPLWCSQTKEGNKSRGIFLSRCQLRSVTTHFQQIKAENRTVGRCTSHCVLGSFPLFIK